MSFQRTGDPPPWLARFFHRFPHLNITGHKVNSTFDWTSEVYRESLGIFASLPALLLIFFLVILLLYLLTRCCDRNAKRDSPLLCLKVLLGFLSIACCAAIGLGLYGNDDFHNGVEIYISSLAMIQEFFVHISNQTLQAQSSIESGVFPLMSKLGVFFERPMGNQSVRDELLTQMSYMEQNMTQTLDSARKIRSYFQDLISASPHSIVRLIETIRWPATLALLVIFIIFCVVLFYAICRHSRCCFISFSVLGLIAVILNWGLVSVYLVGAVALGDICINPNRAAIVELSRAGISSDVSNYYLNCQPMRPELDPFLPVMKDAQKAMEGAQHTLRVINSITGTYYQSNEVDDIVDGLFKKLYDVEGYIGETSTRVDCQPIQGHWIKGVDSLCETSFLGLSFLLLSALVSALLFTLLVGFDSHTWIYIQKRKRYLQQEECVSFLPSNYETGTGGRGTGRRTGGAGSNSHNLVDRWDVRPTPLYF